nr:unnamed protein product [Digitaria exilis]
MEDQVEQMRNPACEPRKRTPLLLAAGPFTWERTEATDRECTQSVSIQSDLLPHRFLHLSIPSSTLSTGLSPSLANHSPDGSPAVRRRHPSASAAAAPRRSSIRREVDGAGGSSQRRQLESVPAAAARIGTGSGSIRDAGLMQIEQPLRREAQGRRKEQGPARRGGGGAWRGQRRDMRCEAAVRGSGCDAK